MNEVYVGYECYYDFCDVNEHAVKVSSPEEAAYCWVEDFEPLSFNDTETQWRSYQKFKVEG